MKKNSFAVVAALLLVLLLAAPSMAWQGRMAGAGDANGLIEDESDYLTHPAAIASGKGLNAYGTYRLTYDKTNSWDYTAGSVAIPVSYPYKASGHEWRNQLQLGSAFALGAGRMGVFFEYDGVKGKYDGQEAYAGFLGPGYNTFDLEDKLNHFKLRVIYGLPAGAVNVGGELQIAYRQEEKENNLFEDDGSAIKNYPWAAEDNPALNLYPYMIPFKSKYWEAQGKVSVDGKAGSAKYAATLKAGLPFASDNRYARGRNYIDSPDLEGKVKGFNIGGDAWVRVPLSGSIILPFVVSAGYKNIKRDSSTMDSGWVNSTEQETKELNVKLGGGVDITPAKGTKVAAGLYYDYLQTKQSMYVDDISSPSEYYIDNYTDMPKYTEHRVTLKALAEKELTTAFILRGGVSAFYGKVKSDYAYLAYSDGGPYYPLDLSTSGSNMGLNASVGATVKIDRFSLEPFLNAGYAKYSTDGDGFLGPYPSTAEFCKTNWLVGGGLSVKF